MPSDAYFEELRASLGTGYTIERELGGGGMARVFAAVDTGLGRRIVVKLLPAESSDAAAIRRFKREIATAARLQHPHIVPLISAGVTAQGVPFYTMPFVPGDSLRARMAAAGGIPREAALRILRDVASALSYAHREGIAHRDIKPENVLLHDDAAVVADFGIAKAVSALRESSRLDGGLEPLSMTSLTVQGTLGTPAYMAPEQVAGDAVDHRADIYAWGVVAYEVLSGVHPFGASTNVQQMVAAHLTEQPAPLAAEGLSPLVSALVMRCLEKNPALRPESAAELMQTLDARTTASAPPHTPARAARLQTLALALAAFSIVAWGAWRVYRGGPGRSDGRIVAVLAFENDNHDTASDYLVEGLGDELRSRLTGVRGLSVKGQASSAQFVGRADPRDVGKRLGVTEVVTGVVRRLGDQMHVAVELDDAVSGDAVWSRTYDADVRAFPSIRDSMAAQVVSALDLQAGALPAAEQDHGTSDFDAYDLFLQGQHASSRLEFGRAAGLYTEAVGRDPNFARAWSSLTIALASEPRDGVTPRDSALAAAATSLARSLALDPTSPLTRVAEAAVRAADFQFPEAASILAAVVAQRPQDPFALEQYAAVLGNLGRIQDAMDVLERIRRVDPMNPFATIGREYGLTMERRFRESLALGARTLQTDPTNAAALHNVGIAYLFLGRADSGIAVLETQYRLDSLALGGTAPLAFAYAADGRWSDVDRLHAANAHRPRNNSPAFDAAIFAIANGRYDSAIDDVTVGVASKQPMFATAWLPCDPMFAVLTDKPRFGAITASLGARLCPPVRAWPIRVRPRG